MDNVERLIEFGLTRQEATLYLALCMEGALSGYEAAKQTGISRSNAYNSLACLVDKGAAYIIEGTVTKYTPVPVRQFCENKLRYLSYVMDEIERDMPTRKEASEGYITITGERQIKDKLVNMLRQTEERVYLSASKKVVEEMADEIMALHKKGVQTILITEPGIRMPGIRMYVGQKDDKQLGVIVDSKFVMTGELDGENSQCLYSGKAPLVEVFKEALRNRMKLI